MMMKTGVTRMGISEEIFEEFFKKLSREEEFPQLVLEELRKLWESGEDISQEKIFGAIKRGCEDVSED